MFSRWIVSAFVLMPSAFLTQTAFAQRQLTFGRFKSRAIFNQAATASCPAPLVIMVPGSGANGPEEMIPGSLTGDDKDHALFSEFSSGLRRTGRIGTLAIGKPGVEFFKSWKPEDHFYDKDMYTNLGWQGLLDNLKDAVDLAATLPCVDHQNIVILGHSEGTQVAIDFANQHPARVKTLLLVGFSGESLATTIDWQLFRRPIDAWLSPDVDKDHDGFISKSEAQVWPEFQWPWKTDQDKVSFAEVEATLRVNPDLQKSYQLLATAKIWQGVLNRPPIYDEASNLTQNIFFFTGSEDVQTRPEEALRLREACTLKKKINCEVQIVPGLSHGMSSPKGPRKQKLLDFTLGPVDESFLKLLEGVPTRL